MEQPLVSVPVITYNSSKTVLETLESIKEQTYQNIELIVSDDCSTDNTVEICRNWIVQNKERFVRTEILTVEKNTGVSGNLNRAEEACRGEWVKGIAGDDMLLPTCVQDCMDYVTEYPETEVLFGRVRAFGGSEEENKAINANVDYSIFVWPVEKLLYQLLYVGNLILAPGYFYHRSLREKYCIINDERIPNIEDWPKWINVLRAGVPMHFLDKDIVLYRIGNGISTRRRSSLKYFESERLMCFYYLYPEWQKSNPNAAIQRIVDEECEIYKHLLEAESEEQSLIHEQRNYYKTQYEKYHRQYNQIYNSKSYRLGRFILHPYRTIKNILCHH